MKTTEAKASSGGSQKNKTPFFQKSGGQDILLPHNDASFFPTSFYGHSTIQPKLTIGQPNDKYEIEADAMADRVVQRKPLLPGNESVNPITPLSTYQVQSKCEACEREDELLAQDDHNEKNSVQRKSIFESTDDLQDENLQRKCTKCSNEGIVQAKNGQVQTNGIEARLASSNGGGFPLPKDTRQEMESSFGSDFSHVRIHNDSSSNQMNRELHSQAFTHGNNIYFNSGKYDTNSRTGKHLLAHELTHVVQQGGYSGNNTRIQRLPDWMNSAVDWVKDTASGAVDTAVGGAQWVGEKINEGAQAVSSAVEQGISSIYNEVRDLINSGISWLTYKWSSIREFAASGLNKLQEVFSGVLNFVKGPFNFLADAIMNFDAGSVSAAWLRFQTIVNSVWEGFQQVTGTLLSQVSGMWDQISGFATTLLSRITSITQNFLFKKLPDTLQRVVTILVSQVKSLWDNIRSGWTKVINNIRTWIEGALETVRQFVMNVGSFAINTIIQGIIQFRDLVLFLKDLFANPGKYIDIMAQQSVQALSGVESRFEEVVNRYFGNTNETITDQPSAFVQRQPQAEAAVPETSSASWSQIGNGIKEVMYKKWQEFKSDPFSIVKSLLLDMFLPIYGNVMDIVHLFKEIYKIVTGPLRAGSLQEFWTSCLYIMDIPILITHTVISILMRTLMLPLLVASFIPHPLVKGIAAAVGYALLGGFVQIELINIGHKLVLLKTGATTDDQKKDAYNRIADSFIALVLTAVIIVIVIILHFLASVVKSIYNFVKGKVFNIEKPPVEVKTGEGKGGESKTGEGKGAEGKGSLKDSIPSEDGKRRLRMNEKGNCEVCASPCAELRERYKKVMTPELEGKIKAIETDGKLTDPQKQQKLQPIEQELANLNNKTGVDITDQIKQGRVKPEGGKWKQANNWEKWVTKHKGRVIEYADGSFDLIEPGGTKVRYSPDGYPDFSPHLDHPSGIKQVDIDGFDPKRKPDYAKANKAVGKEAEWGSDPPDNYRWHHHQNGRTMQLVPEWIHTLFRHAGGISNL